MTIREAIIAEVQVSGYSEAAIDKALIDLELDGDDDYEIEQGKNVATAAVKVLRAMSGVKSIREGGYDITYAINERISSLVTEYGLQITSGPIVKAYNGW